MLKMLVGFKKHTTFMNLSVYNFIAMHTMLSNAGPEKFISRGHWAPELQESLAQLHVSALSTKSWHKGLWSGTLCSVPPQR